MPPPFDFDGTLKELFQQDRPTLLRRLSRGVAVREFLNVELPKVQQRRVDLLVALADDTLLHIEFQSARDRHIAYRMLEYWVLIQRRIPRPLRQVVLYVGQGAARIPDRIQEEGLSFRYEVMDLREIQAEDLVKTGNQGDLALAVLAGGGDARLPQILRRAARVKGAQRQRLLAKILLLSGLRGAAEKVEWELRRMGVIIDVTKNPVLMRMYAEAEAKAKAKAKAEAKAEVEAKVQAKVRAEQAKVRAESEARAKAEMFHDLLEAKFGLVPRWASVRVSNASPTQLERWIKKVLVAEKLQDVLGPRHRNGS